MNRDHANRATVKAGLIAGKNVHDTLTTLDTVCEAGAGSPEVQTSPTARSALVDLRKAVKTAHGSYATKLDLARAILAAAQALNLDLGVVRLKLRGYQTAVNTLAHGNADLINRAGLLSRIEQKPPPRPLGKVTVVRSKVGKRRAEARLSWPAAPGATSYTLEVNWTPGNPAGRWITLMSGTGRRRIIKAPAAASQFLARVAAVASDGTHSEWSDVVIATTL